MKLFSIFIAAVLAISMFSNLREQAEHLGAGLTQHASSARKFAIDKTLHSFSEAKKACGWLKEKILSKFRREHPKKEEAEEKLQEPEFEMNSSTLNEFIKKFTEELAKQQKLHEGSTGTISEKEEKAESNSDEITEVAETDNKKLAL